MTTETGRGSATTVRDEKSPCSPDLHIGHGFAGGVKATEVSLPVVFVVRDLQDDDVDAFFQCDVQGGTLGPRLQHEDFGDFKNPWSLS